MKATYQICIKGQLDTHLSAWFSDFTITHTADGDSLLTGEVADQAALYGVVARCRDMGLTLISLQPIETKMWAIQQPRGNTQETTMNKVQAQQSQIIHARPEAIYAVLSDYVVAHQAILPKPYFAEMIVEKGGKGAGTIYRLRMNVFGQEMRYHHIVSEPEPGRVIVETDVDTGQFSQFTIDPINGGQHSRVTIFAESPASPGIKGAIEKLMNPPVMRHIFKKELNNLANYVQAQG